jgi:2-polyprenyl-6-methoxyphenol hydroxylase-like FAD-dependent oxidoreductase
LDWALVIYIGSYEKYIGSCIYIKRRQVKAASRFEIRRRLRETTMITIIGAGMAGLTLARVLYKNGITPVVYDADLSVTSRHQGGMLDIHHDTGQAALQAAGLLDTFGELILENGDAIRILDKTGALRMSDDGNGLRPEIDRGALRDLLLSSLPAGIVRWNAKVVGIDKVDDNYELTFADGKVVTTAVLIGADGAWSKVRPLVSDASPAYTGLSAVELHYRDADQNYPTAAALVGNGLMFALSDQRGLIGHREPNSALRVYAALKVPEAWSGQPITRDMLHEHFAGWHEDFHQLLPRATAICCPGRSSHCRWGTAGRGRPASPLSGTRLT